MKYSGLFFTETNDVNTHSSPMQLNSKQNQIVHDFI